MAPPWLPQRWFPRPAAGRCLALTLAAIVLLGAALTGCRGLSPPSSDLVLFAASSLMDSFDELANAYQDRNPGIEIVPNYASSAQLAAQLAQGAQADLFTAANHLQIEAAAEAGRLRGQPRVFATNELVLLLPGDNPAGIESIADLGAPGVRLILATPSTPLREYTEDVLNQLAADPAVPAELLAAIRANVVSEEDNARQVVAKIALGEADAAFAYRSATCSPLARATIHLEVPTEYAVEARYLAAIVEGTSQPARAADFLDFLLSAPGQQILQASCFGPAPAE